MVTISIEEYAAIRARQENARAKKSGLTVSKIVASALSNPKQSKYHNEKVGGFDSKKEYRRAIVLEAMVDNGDIQCLRKQVSFELQNGFRSSSGEWVRPIKYVADFVYVRNGRTVIEDVKGFRTEVYKIKRKMFLKLISE